MKRIKDFLPRKGKDSRAGPPGDSRTGTPEDKGAGENKAAHDDLDNLDALFDELGASSPGKDETSLIPSDDEGPPRAGIPEVSLMSRIMETRTAAATSQEEPERSPPWKSSQISRETVTAPDGNLTSLQLLV